MKTIVFTIAFVFMTVVAFGQNNQQGKATKKAQTEAKANLGQKGGANYVDADKDGVCDNYKSGTRQGKGQGKGTMQGKGKRNGNGQGTCNGQGPKGQGKGQGQGPNFVDADKDGVCDNQGAKK